MKSSFLTSVDSAISKQKQSRAKELAFSVQKVHAIDDNQARMAILVERPYFGRLNDENLSVAIASAFPNTRYLPNSLHRVSDTDKRLYGVFVEKNIRTMSMEQASTDSGFVQVNDTVYQDANDEIWTVQKDGETSYLVSQVDDNITTLIGGLSARAIATASHGIALEEDFGAGNAVLYYNPVKAEVAFGVATNGLTVYNPDSERLVDIEAAYVIGVHDNTGIAVETASSKEDLLAYMKKLYGHHAEFFAKIKAIISATATA